MWNTTNLVILGLITMNIHGQFFLLEILSGCCNRVSCCINIAQMHNGNKTWE